ncbi:MAG: hypothetical protein AAFR53_13640 [Pseudomonadota bacterium]
MSDPVTNVDIEDVLSSIRRLVSQDTPPRKVEPQGAQALILTQAHRVAEVVDAPAEDDVAEEQDTVSFEAADYGAGELEDEAPAPKEETFYDAYSDDDVEIDDMDDTSEDVSDTEDHSDHADMAEALDAEDNVDFNARAATLVRSELERAIEELEASMGLPQSDDEAITEEAQPDTETDVDLEPAEDTAEWDAEDVQSFEATDALPDEEMLDDLDEDEPAAELADTYEEELTSHAPEEIDWDAPVGRAVDGPPPGYDEAKEAFAPAEFEASPHEDDEPEVIHDEQEEAEPSALESLRIVTSAAPSDAESYDESYEGDVLAGAHLEIEEEEDVPEEAPALHFSHRVEAEPVSEPDTGPDPVPEPEQASAPEPWEDVEAAEAFVEPEPPFDAHHDDPFTNTEEPVEAMPSDMQIDEEILRDMVSEIVRAELQGELGERITRNVRKLVRREINRALAGQDLI